MKKNTILLFLVLLILYIFKGWFLLNPLSAGDWSFNFLQTLKSFTIFPYIWNWTGFATGLGGNIAFFLGLSAYFSSTASMLSNFFNMQWVLIERMVWFWPFLIISVFSSALLFKKLFSNKFFLISSFIYLFNSYVLMIVGGGQMGIATAYSLTPFLFILFFNLVNQENFKNSLFFSLILSILVLFDIRVAYIVIFGIFIYWLLKLNEIKKFRKILKSFLIIFFVPGIVTILINSFWIIPLIFGGKNLLAELGSAYSSSDAVRFFSFAKFEDTISLLHPNWPENIFGKVGFMRPEFLLLPILAFSSLFFVSKIKELKTKNYILFFVLLGLIGAFLAKGSNDPFGGIYLWMFDHVPGFVMFRDSTKFYLLVAISYSILIPFSISKMYEMLKLKTENLKPKVLSFFPNLFIFLVLGYMLFLIRPALLGQLGGTFKTTTIPAEYIKLEQFLSSQNNFSRTLWLPTQQRFGFYSNVHPAVSAQDLFSIYDYKLIQKLSLSEKLLQESAVKYVIVPYDSQGEIFLTDRKYDNKLYLQLINQFRTIKWLKQVNGFGRIVVFEVSNSKDHFWTTSKTLNLKYKYISPVEYSIEVKNAKKGDVIIFSESYDPKWIAISELGIKNKELRINSTKFNNRFNSFVLSQSGDYLLKIYYTPQDYVNIGLVISGLTLMLVISVLIYLRKKK